MNVSETMERPAGTTPTTTGRDRRALIIGLVAVGALLLGALGGFFLGRSSDDDTRAYFPGGSELTERQEEMVQMVEDYVTARQNGDAEALKAMFASTASVSILGREYEGSNGELDGYFTSAHYPSIALREPMLVLNDAVVIYVDGDSRRSFTNEIEFTTSGDVKIVSHEV